MILGTRISQAVFGHNFLYHVFSFPHLTHDLRNELAVSNLPIFRPNAIIMPSKKSTRILIFFNNYVAPPALRMLRGKKQPLRRRDTEIQRFIR